jgi:predicted tellurium resistance membrane protein TerC
MKRLLLKWIDVAVDAFHWSFEIVVVILFFVTLSLIVVGVYHKETVLIPNAYIAWEKQTGNPKGLTFDEWNSLRIAMDR